MAINKLLIYTLGFLYISNSGFSSMPELIKQGMKQKLEKSWHVESNYLLQPPKYSIIVFNRLRYINKNFTKDRCSILMDMTVVLGLHKFSLQATIDHHGPSMYSGHYTASINCCKLTIYCNDSKITEFESIDTKNSSTAYVVMYNWLHIGFRARTGGWEFWLLPWRWHIPSIPLKAGRGISAETCGLDEVFPPDDLGSGPCTPFIIYIPHIIAAFLLIKIYSF